MDEKWVSQKLIAVKSKAHRAGMAWPVVYTSDQTQSGACFWTITVVDVLTREYLAKDLKRKPGAADLVKVLTA